MRGENSSFEKKRIRFEFKPRCRNSDALPPSQLSVNSYDGFMSPALFLQLNTLPTLSSYAYYNTSSGSSSHPKVSIGVQNPQNAVYVIGVFLYGSSSSLTVTANWNCM